MHKSIQKEKNRTDWPGSCLETKCWKQKPGDAIESICSIFLPVFLKEGAGGKTEPNRIFSSPMTQDFHRYNKTEMFRQPDCGYAGKDGIRDVPERIQPGAAIGIHPMIESGPEQKQSFRDSIPSRYGHHREEDHDEKEILSHKKIRTL